MKHIVTMQDVSCVGKCSLTVALPIISVMGVECSVIPTSVLSTHTMFKNFTFHDLTSEIEPIMKHWEKEGFHFDGIYTGYLGSFEQLSIAQDLFERFGKGKPILIDPVMADNGHLYPGFTQEFAQSMARLCGHADMICPNLTEASFLLQEPYLEKDYTEQQIQDTLKKLCGLGCRAAILTGISLEPGKLGAYAYDSREDAFYQHYEDTLPAKFHGTGDIWASTFFGATIMGKSFTKALEIACRFTTESIRLTLEEPDHNIYGVNFEQALPDLIRMMQED